MEVASRRVVITGTGVVSAQGADGRITSWDPRPHFRQSKALKLTDRTTQFAVAAAAMALADSGWLGDDDQRERLGVLIGVSGSDLLVEDLARALQSDGAPTPVGDIQVFADHILSRLTPLWLLVNLPNMPSAHVAIQLGARGPNSTVMTDWVAGSQAIGEAADWIRHGEADAVLAGGADSMMQPFALASYDQAGLLAAAPDHAPRFVPAEGAAVLMLEERAHALARGATVLGELVGYASASSPLDAPPSALARTMAAATREAGWTASDVNAVVHADVQSSIGHAGAAVGPIRLCQWLGGATHEQRCLSNTLGFSGQSVTLAISRHHGAHETP